MAMFDFTHKEHCGSRCYVTHGTMGHIDRKQPPTKRKPFAPILAIPFVHKAELLLPQELFEHIKDDLFAKFSSHKYSRVILPLSALLEGDFFTEYIKKGDIVMLSEGQKDINNIYYLRDGILTLKLDKESYERAGLVGKPDGCKGKRGARSRWVVEINLRLPSMLHGKKGFDRLVYAFTNALKTPVTWLFADLKPSSNPCPLDIHFPLSLSSKPSVFQVSQLQVPRLQPPSDAMAVGGGNFKDFASDLHEWFSLVSLGSPRITTQDDIDVFLSRYRTPVSEDLTSVPQDLVRVIWEGFMPSILAHSIFVYGAQEMSSKMWLSFSAWGFGESLSETRDCTVLKLPGISNEYIMWEIENR